MILHTNGTILPYVLYPNVIRCDAVWGAKGVKERVREHSRAETVGQEVGKERNRHTRARRQEGKGNGEREREECKGRKGREREARRGIERERERGRGGEKERN